MAWYGECSRCDSVFFVCGLHSLYIVWINKFVDKKRSNELKDLENARKSLVVETELKNIEELTELVTIEVDEEIIKEILKSTKKLTTEIEKLDIERGDQEAIEYYQKNYLDKGRK